jgi:hypothetical protein
MRSHCYLTYITQLAAAFVTGVTPAGAATLAAWVQLGPGSQVNARAITDNTACPLLQADGAFLAMRTRSDPETPFGNVKTAPFPVRACEVEVPASTVSLRLGDKPLPLPPKDLRRVVLLGDTGCRLRITDTGVYEVQDCNDAKAWPYPKLAAHAAQARPDLVIHLGDYHYRESPCPRGRAGCEGSPFGYGWDVWNLDFFLPSAPLLAAAPWLMVRGNHEDCDRAGEGWFRLLDSAPLAQECRDLTGFFVSKPGNMGFVVMDGARTNDPVGDASKLVETLQRQFAQVRDSIPVEAWLLTHRPMNALRADALGKGNVVENSVQQAAIGEDLPAGVRMVVSGHNHFFEALDFTAIRPPQLVVGTGGDKLTPPSPEPLVGKYVNGARVSAGMAWSGFAYMVWDKGDAIWEGTLFDEDGQSILHCRLINRWLGCSRYE